MFIEFNLVYELSYLIEFISLDKLNCLCHLVVYKSIGFVLLHEFRYLVEFVYFDRNTC